MHLVRLLRRLGRGNPRAVPHKCVHFLLRFKRKEINGYKSREKHRIINSCLTVTTRGIVNKLLYKSYDDIFIKNRKKNVKVLK